MSDFIIDVTEQTFEQEVLRRSLQVPVVVDFWAEWCGPCHALSPILERAVTARQGQVVLAKVDVDRNPRLAMAFGVQGIPAVKAFQNGRLVAEFVGAQPAQVVERFLDALLPSPADRMAAEAAGLDPEQAAKQWRQVLEEDPDNVPARAGLARLALDRGDPEEALALLRPVEHAPEVAELMARARLAIEAQGDDPRFAQAARQATDGAPEEALASLLAAVKEGGAARERARVLMLDIFRLLGDSHPLTVRYRRELTSALF